MVKKIPKIRKALIEQMVDYIKTRDETSSKISTSQYNQIIGQKNKGVMELIIAHNEDLAKKIDEISPEFGKQDKNTAKKQLTISYEGLTTEILRRNGKIGIQASLRLALLDGNAREKIFDKLEATEINEKKVNIMDILLTTVNTTQKDKRKLLQAREVTLLFEKKTLRKNYLASLKTALTNFKKIDEKRLMDDKEFLRLQLKRIFKDRILKNAYDNKKPSGQDVKTMKTVLTKSEFNHLIKQGEKFCSGFAAAIENS